MFVQVRGAKVLVFALVETLVLSLPLNAQTPDLSGNGRPGDRGGAASCFQTASSFDPTIRITTNTRRCAFFATN